MQRVLLLGAGRQGRVALLDLANQAEVVAADRELAALEAFVRERGVGQRVICRPVDVTDLQQLQRLVGEGFSVVLSLLPVALHDRVAEAAVANGVHLVTSSYPSPTLRSLDDTARERGVALLPEMGLDPGIDLVLMAEAVRRLDRVEELTSYAAGFPEMAAAEPPIRYKTTWTLEGVLRSYRRAACVVRDGAVVEVAADDIFHPDRLHLLSVAGIGTLEAFPNGDVVPYLELLGLDPAHLRSAGRYVLRWPGHAQFWRRVVALGLLDDEPIRVDGCELDRRRVLAAALAPRLQYRDNERDVAVVRVEAAGWRHGRPARVVLELVDRRDLGSGFFAMNRTVGHTAAIGVALLLDGSICDRGLLSPARHVPYGRLARELRRRGMVVAEIGP